jgi:Zn-finger nucleic acid-binding protein
MSNRIGIEVDYCPKCRGIWLDRVELDKFVDRSKTSHSDHKESSEWNGDLKKYTENGIFHSSSHQERQFKHGKLKTLLREILE